MFRRIVGMKAYCSKFKRERKKLNIKNYSSEEFCSKKNRKKWTEDQGKYEIKKRFKMEGK